MIKSFSGFPDSFHAVLVSSLLVGKRDIVVPILVWCMCVRPSGFVRTIACTIMCGFQNNLAQLLSLKRRMPFETFF